jgi:hypothetical protein
MEVSFRQTSTTSASKWRHYTSGFPIIFSNGERPKAVFLNDAGNVTLVGEDDVQATFTPAIGVPIQVRPKQITSTSAPGGVIALFD